MSDSWSKSEKVVARAAYDKALAAALNEHLERFRRFEVDSFGDLWKIESELGEWRKELAELFIYSYSRLEISFLIYMRYGWITLDDLAGLSEERLAYFREVLERKLEE